MYHCDVCTKPMEWEEIQFIITASLPLDSGIHKWYFCSLMCKHKGLATLRANIRDRLLTVKHRLSNGDWYDG